MARATTTSTEADEQQQVADDAQRVGVDQVGDRHPEVPGSGAEGGAAEQQPGLLSTPGAAVVAVAAGSSQREPADHQSRHRRRCDGRRPAVRWPGPDRSVPGPRRSRGPPDAAVEHRWRRSSRWGPRPEAGTGPPCPLTLAGGDGGRRAHYDGPLGGPDDEGGRGVATQGARRRRRRHHPRSGQARPGGGRWLAGEHRHQRAGGRSPRVAGPPGRRAAGRDDARSGRSRHGRVAARGSR